MLYKIVIMKSLKLSNLENSVELDSKEMSNVVGAASASCTCGCFYAETGGSSTNNNGSANAKGGLTSVVRLKEVVVQG